MAAAATRGRPANTRETCAHSRALTHNATMFVQREDSTCNGSDG